VADFIGAKEEEIIFTSGSTESNNMVIRGFDDYYKLNISTIITTPIEHSSIFKVLENCYLTSDVYLCEVDKYGFVDLEVLEELLEYKKEGILLVSIGMANNEIGTVQDIKKISELVHSYNGILHVDATQALAHIPIDVNELGIDLLSASAHKIGGLKGTGFLYKRTCIELKPLIYGEQEKNMRGGTENTIGIIALGEAIKHIEYNPMLVYKRDYMLYRLENRFNCKLNGDLFERLPNNINVTFPDVTGESLLYSLDLANIYISTGSACKGNSSEPSHVLKAIGLTEEEAMRTVRFTLPVDITFEEIDIVLEEIDKAIKIINTGSEINE
jgi:cysteine desulfurase